MKIENRRFPKEIKPENTQNLEEVYKKVYTCENCGIKYGSDLKKEQVPFLCPLCSSKEKIKR